MQTNDHQARSIRTYRVLTEQRLAQLLEDAESALSIDQVKNLVFEGHDSDFGLYVTAMLSVFKCDDIDNADSAVL